MPMNGQVVGQQIAAALVGLPQTDKEDPAKIWAKVFELFVAHMASTALVTVTVTTTGSAAAQAGTGTGTIA